MELRIAGLVNESIVDGPGLRYAVFTQGCPHGCEGCHNPQTHSFEGGSLADTDDIFKDILKDPLLDGVTFSGGEPFCQCAPLADLARKIHSKGGMNVISYTGYTFEYLISHADEKNGFMQLLENCDYIIDGRFELDKRSLELKFRGSGNQRFIDVKRSLESKKAVALTDEEIDRI